VQIRVKLSLGFVIGMRNVISCPGTFTGNLAYSRHLSLVKMDCKYRKKLLNEKPATHLILWSGFIVLLQVESIWAMAATVFTTYSSLKQILGGKNQKPVTIIIKISLLQGSILMRPFIFCRQANWLTLGDLKLTKL